MRGATGFILVCILFKCPKLLGTLIDVDLLFALGLRPFNIKINQASHQLGIFCCPSLGALSSLTSKRISRLLSLKEDLTGIRLDRYSKDA